jgi:hypothetical protein
MIKKRRTNGFIAQRVAIELIRLSLREMSMSSSVERRRFIHGMKKIHLRNLAETPTIATTQKRHT